MNMAEAEKELKKRFQSSPWIDFLLKVEEVRELQRQYYKKKDKVVLAKCKLAEIELDQQTKSLRNIAEAKNLL